MTPLLQKFTISESKNVLIDQSFHKMYLYGTTGSGKSHAAAMLVIALTAEGVPVAYIPDCRQLQDDFVETIRNVLLMTCAGNDAQCGALLGADSDGLREACRSIRPLWVLDQADCLEPEPEALPEVRKYRVELNARLQKLIGLSSCLRVVSASNTTAKKRKSSNPDYSEATVFGGLDEVSEPDSRVFL